MIIRLLLVPLALVAAGCASAPPRVSSPRFRDALIRADMAAGAISSRTTADAVAGALAHDAVFLAPRHGYVHGRDAIRSYLDTDSLFRGTTITWQPIAAEVSSDGTHGYTFGYSEVTRAKNPSTPGKYLAYWRRDASGEWRIAALKLLRRPPGTVSYRVVTEGRLSNTSGPVDTAATLAALMQVDREFSALAQKGPLEAFRAYASVTSMTTGSGPVFALGREAVAKEFATFAPGTVAWSPRFGQVARSGDLAFVSGDVDFFEKQPDGTMKAAGRGQYLTIWRRQPDGTWRFVADA
jgi:ketosteroid isomerase-like protein